MQASCSTGPLGQRCRQRVAVRQHTAQSGLPCAIQLRPPLCRPECDYPTAHLRCADQAQGSTCCTCRPLFKTQPPPLPCRSFLVQLKTALGANGGAPGEVGEGGGAPAPGEDPPPCRPPDSGGGRRRPARPAARIGGGMQVWPTHVVHGERDVAVLPLLSVYVCKASG
jgi:hypothetical protein